MTAMERQISKVVAQKRDNALVPIRSREPEA